MSATICQKNLYTQKVRCENMKKSVLIISFLLIILTLNVHAVSYGGNIPRIQEFPAEREERSAIAQGKAQVPQTLSSGNELKDLQRNMYLLNDQIVSLRTTIQNVQADQNAQMSNIVSEITTVRGAVDELQDLKRMRDELPQLIEQKTAPSLFLTIILLLNFLLLCAIVGILWQAREFKERTRAVHSHRDLYEYIKKSVRSGVHIRNIKHYLVDHGWDEDEVDKAIHELREGEAK